MLDETLDFIARRIQKLRDTRGVSARDLSLSCGLNAGWVNKMETKQQRPSIEGLDYICEYFNITLAEFFDEGTESPLQVKNLIDEVKGLDGDSIEILIATAKKMKGQKK